MQYTNVGCTAGETLLQHQKQQQKLTETKFLRSPPQTSGKLLKQAMIAIANKMKCNVFNNYMYSKLGQII